MRKLLTHRITWLSALAALVVCVLVWRVGPASRDADAAPAQARAPAASAPVAARQLRLGLNIAAGSALHAAALRFAEQVGQRSQGRLQVTVYPDQKLGSDEQMLEQARAGQLELLLTPTAKLSSAIPAMQYADLPFYFADRDELHAMLDGEPGRMLLAKLGAIDLVGLTFWENGFKQFTANTPIRTPQDFARLRIRTMKSPLIAAQFASLGALPIPIDFHATRQALAEGAVDGQENPLVAIVGMRFHEVQKHLTLSNHAWLGYVFSASRRAFATLAPDERQLLQDTARELTQWERQETARRETEFIAQVRAAGVQVHELSAAERERFMVALSPIADQFGLTVGYDLLAKTDELRRHAAAGTPVPAASVPWLLGLDADLSGGSAQAGGAIYRGMQLAVDEINRQGGVLGRPLAILARDHAGSPTLGVANLRHFAAEPSMLAVMGGAQTTVVAAQLDDIHRLGMPFLIPWAAGAGLVNHGQRPNYTFRLSLNDSQVAPFLLDRALKLGPRVTVVLERSTWGRGIEQTLQPLVARLPSGSVAWAWIDPADPGTPAQLDGWLARGTDVLLLVTGVRETRAVVSAMARAAQPVPIVSHWGPSVGDFSAGLQPALQKVDLRFVVPALIDEAQDTPRQREFLRRYRQRYGVAASAPVPSLAGTMHAYDLTHLLARAVQQARSGDRAAVRQALERLPRHAGVVRDYAPPFTAERHEALDGGQLRLARFDPRGRIVAAD